jgi:two-component system, NtrC family, sensor histidine kinase GlrK
VNLSIYWKMVIGFGVIVIAMVLVYAYLLVNLHSVSSALTATLSSDVEAIDRAQQLHTFFFEEERYARKYLLTRDPTYTRLFQEARERSVEGMDSLAHVLNRQREVTTFRQLRDGHEWIRTALASPSVASLPAESAVADTMDALRARIDLLIRLNQGSITHTVLDVETTTNRSVGSAIMLILAALLATIVVALIITRTITRPLSILQRGTEQVARGEFRPVPVHSRDEIGKLARAFNTMSERLRRLEEYKAEMMQQISHELRTPLQSMQSAHYLLAEQIVGPLNEKQHNLLTTIRDNIDTITTFSNQFLDLSKIEAGMMEFHKTSMDLLSVITPVLNSARVLAMQKEITIGLAAQSVPPVAVDEDKFATVLKNLLSNAIKFTNKGGNITVTVGPCPTGVRVSVKDTGIGIDPDDMPKLFTKFYQAKNASKINVKGTGVGLALVRAIVEGHGGRVYATSTVGGGSTFTVELPVAHEEPVRTPVYAH